MTNGLLFTFNYWIRSDSQIASNCDSLSAGEIQYFFSQRIKVGNDLQELYMACVSWYQDHPGKNRSPELIQV